MPSNWTPERRAAQAERARALAPWRYSTGARTQRGKARVACNAYKHGNTSAAMRRFNAALTLHRRGFSAASI